MSGGHTRDACAPHHHKCPPCNVGLRRVGQLGRGAEAGVSTPLTGLFFQMIESNDISGDKIRMKDTVEGELPLGRQDTGLWGQAGWFCL